MPWGHLLPREVKAKQLQRLVTKTWDVVSCCHQMRLSVPPVKNADFSNKPDLIIHTGSRLVGS